MKHWNGSKWIRREGRYAIYERDGFRCLYCGEFTAELHLDHLRPRSRGGNNDPRNLVTACGYCNRSRGDRPWWQFASDDAEKRIKRNRRRSVKARRKRAKQILDASSWNDALSAAVLAARENDDA